MKGYRLQVVGYSFLLFVLLSTVHGTLYPTYAADLGQSRINPASPLYFLKSIREILEIKFAGTTQVKAIRQLEFATRRIREVKSLVNDSRQDLIEPTLVRYLSHLDQLIGILNLRDENWISQVSDEISLHMNTLQTVYDQVSHPRARMSIRATVNGLSQWDQKLIDRLNSLNKSSLAQKVIISKLVACNFLSKEASSSSLNEVERAVLSERAQRCLQPKP